MSIIPPFTGSQALEKKLLEGAGQFNRAIGGAFTGAAKAYDEYGKNLRSSLGTDQSFAEDFLSGKLSEVKNATKGKTRAFGTEYDMSDPAQVAALNREQAENLRLQGNPKFADLRGGSGIKSSVVPVEEVTSTQQPLTPVVPTQVRSNMADASELDRYREFVKANRSLAEKVKPGQAGYEEIQIALGKAGSADPEETLAFMADTGKSAEEAGAILSGGSVETLIDGNKPFETTINPAPAAQKFAADRVALVSEAMKNAGFQAPTMKSSAMTMEFRDANGNGIDDRFESIPNPGFDGGSATVDLGIDPRLVDRMKEMGLIRGYEHNLEIMKD